MYNKNIVDRFIQNGDGIYFLYSDHLSCDAAYIYVIKDSKAIEELHPSCYCTRNYYGDGAPCGIIPTIREFKNEYPELDVFATNMGYYTFPSKWLEHDYTDTLKEYKVEVKDVIDIKDLVEKNN